MYYSFLSCVENERYGVVPGDNEEKVKTMNPVYLVSGLQNYIALCSLREPQFSSTFVKVSGPFYIPDKNIKLEIVSMFCEYIVLGFPMLQSASTMEKDLYHTNTCMYI